MNAEQFISDCTNARRDGETWISLFYRGQEIGTLWLNKNGITKVEQVEHNICRIRSGPLCVLADDYKQRYL